LVLAAIVWLSRFLRDANAGAFEALPAGGNSFCGLVISGLWWCKPFGHIRSPIRAGGIVAKSYRVLRAAD
jgi:hypothetical protein